MNANNTRHTHTQRERERQCHFPSTISSIHTNTHIHFETSTQADKVLIDQDDLWLFIFPSARPPAKLVSCRIRGCIFPTGPSLEYAVFRPRPKEANMPSPATNERLSVGWTPWKRVIGSIFLYPNAHTHVKREREREREGEGEREGEREQQTHTHTERERRRQRPTLCTHVLKTEIARS